MTDGPLPHSPDDGLGTGVAVITGVDLLDVGLRSSLVASYYAAPLLIGAGRGLVGFTSEFTGHVIAALAADPGVLAVSGRTLIGAEVAQRYGITDRWPAPAVSPRADARGASQLSGKGRAMTDDQLQQLLKDVQYLRDRQSILDVIMRHARGHDRHDTELMNRCFWDDGVDEHGQFVTPGPGYGTGRTRPTRPVSFPTCTTSPTTRAK